MKPELLELLKDLADVLEKHAGGLSYKTSDDGIYASVGESWRDDVCIEWPQNGNVSRLREIIQANASDAAMTALQQTLDLPQDAAGQSLAASPCSAILDVTMGHRGMQKEMRERFGIDGPITSLDIRPVMGNGMRPDVVADSRNMPFPDASFDLVMFDPPFSFHNSKSCGNAQYSRFYVTYGLNLYKTRAELGEYIRGTFKEIARVLTADGQCVMKWSESRIKLDFPLSLAGDLVEVKRWQRPSKHWGTKTGTATWYVWFALPNASDAATGARDIILDRDDVARWLHPICSPLDGRSSSTIKQTANNMTPEELKELREKCYGMSAANLNPEDVADYMAIASAAARMESRKAAQSIPPEGGWKKPA